MKCICFTGHRSLTENQIKKIQPLLQKEINAAYIDGARLFYTAEAGSFDSLVIRQLIEYKSSHSDIKIIALHSARKRKNATQANEIIKLINFFEEYKQIIKSGNRLICFVENIEGCAFKLMRFAEKNKIEIINIAENN